MRPELEAVLTLARSLDREELPHLLGELEEIRATAHARRAAPPPAGAPDRLMGIKEAAATLAVSPAYLYQNHNRYSFTRRMGKRLLFSRHGIEKYMRSIKTA